LFVSPKHQENRLTKLSIARPLGELDLGDQDRLDPRTTLKKFPGPIDLVFSLAGSRKDTRYA
jgi:hypothetical protein